MECKTERCRDFYMLPPESPTLPQQLTKHINQQGLLEQLLNKKEVPVNLDMKNWTLSTTTSEGNLKELKEKVGNACTCPSLIVFPDVLQYTKDIYLRVGFKITSHGSESLGRFTVELKRNYPKKPPHL